MNESIGKPGDYYVVSRPLQQLCMVCGGTEYIKQDGTSSHPNCTYILPEDC